MQANRLLIRTFAVALATLLGDSAMAQCESLTRNGLFDFQSLTSDDQRTESFVNWARDKRGGSAANNAGGNLSGSLLDILSVDLGGNSSKTEQFWQDIETYSSGNTEQRNRLLKYAKTANASLIDGFNKCINTKGLHVWIEMTSRPDTFRVAANFNSPGVPVSAQIENVTLSPPSPAVSCNSVIRKGTKVTGSTKRLTCKRLSCESVVVSVNADVDPIGGGSLNVPRICRGGSPAKDKTFAERINVGKSFTVTFDSLTANIGTIYPSRALTGVYSQGEQAWRVSGPNGPTGELVQGNDRGLYGCGTVVPQGRRDSNCYKPTEHWLNLWGAIFSFTDQGQVKFQNVIVGRLGVAE